jgi:hypothetical protein
MADQQPKPAKNKARVDPLATVESVIDPKSGEIVKKTAQEFGGEGRDGLYRWGQTSCEIIMQTLLPDGIKAHDVTFE